MPTYEYACKKCGHEFEIFQSMKDAPLTKCPKCKKPALKRLVGGGAGLIFKGSGFYITDYKKSGTKTESSGSGDKAASTTKSDPKKSPPASSGTAASTSK